jgi:hypothetical protein
MPSLVAPANRLVSVLAGSGQISRGQVGLGHVGVVPGPALGHEVQELPAWLASRSASQSPEARTASERHR